ESSAYSTLNIRFCNLLDRHKRVFNSLQRAADAVLGGTTGEHADVDGKGLCSDFQALGHGQIGTPLGGQLGHGHISCQDIAPRSGQVSSVGGHGGDPHNLVGVGIGNDFDKPARIAIDLS